MDSSSMISNTIKKLDITESSGKNCSKTQIKLFKFDNNASKMEVKAEISEKPSHHDKVLCL